MVPAPTQLIQMIIIRLLQSFDDWLIQSFLPHPHLQFLFTPAHRWSSLSVCSCTVLKHHLPGCLDSPSSLLPGGDSAFLLSARRCFLSSDGIFGLSPGCSHRFHHRLWRLLLTLERLKVKYILKPWRLALTLVWWQVFFFWCQDRNDDKKLSFCHVTLANLPSTRHEERVLICSQHNFTLMCMQLLDFSHCCQSPRILCHCVYT